MKGALLALSLLAATPASALVDILCLGSQTLNYSPGLRLYEQQVRVSGAGSFSPCIVPGRPDLTSGSFTVAPFQQALSCSLSRGEGMFSYTWNTGETSTIQAATDIQVAPGVVIVESRGKVVSGLFTGATVVFTWLATSPNPLGCLALQGITQYTGLTVLVMTPLL